MRPALKRGLLPVWRNRDTLQIGIDPRRAVALTGMGGAARLLGLLDGSRERAQLLSAAAELGIPADAADRILALLAAGGALDDIPGCVCPNLPVSTRVRLEPELATAGLAFADGDGGARTLARRQSARVRVHGASEAGLRIASLLSAAGIGQVVSTGVSRPQGGEPPSTTEPVWPGPPGPCRDGRANGGGALGGPRPDLVVLADTHRRDLPASLMRALVPHLFAHASEAIGVVGPFVLPRRSACLRCLDLIRADLDPAWPLIIAQLASHVAEPAACDVVLTTAVAAQAAAQVLTFVDRAVPSAAVINGTLELVLPDWQWRRRSWEPHQRCGCGSRSAS